MMKRPKTIQLRERGQLTLPKEVREEIGVGERAMLSIFTIGDALVLTTKKLIRADLAAEFQRKMGEQKLTLKDLLTDLKEQRTRYVKETYGTG